uniref:Trehalase n=1 Tax=Apocheima cinerarius TaxID=706528 RepID=A0A9E7V6S8_APOCI|nr:soluble trehalase [Apocheima cinerarius]
MKHLLLVVLAAAAVVTDDLPPSCDKPVYCDSDLLHHVQMANLYPDSKTFVDLQMRKDENTTLNAFQKLLDDTNNAPTQGQLRAFVNEYFDDSGELENWTPTDYNDNPAIVNKINDENLRQFAKDINNIWPTLGRKVKPIVFEKPDQFSFIPVSNGFIVPGGRFKEIYYWDAYWIIEGLLISGMEETAKGMIENLIELLKKLGHIPNGSRWYYQERSQPPLLSAMVMRYYERTKDIAFLKKHIRSLEKELHYWMDTQIVTFSKDDTVYTLLRYYAPSTGPRPESYFEDYDTAQKADSHEDHTEFYVDIKSAAESGWDFSTRWFISPEGDNSGNLTNIHTRYIIPVDLNAIFANALENAAVINAKIGDLGRATHWGFLAKQWRYTIEKVLWHEKDGIWYDYDTLNSKHRDYFYPSNLAPLWMLAVEKEKVTKHAPKVINYLKHSQGLDYPGGIPVSLSRSGEQWDFPNVWPPEVSIVIKGLQGTKTVEGEKMAFHLAQEWVRICRKGFLEHKQMFEKYDAEIPGRFGGGGEYSVQEGFGWSNGVVLECLDDYGDVMTAYDTVEPNEGLKVLPLQAEKNEKKSILAITDDDSEDSDSEDSVNEQ